MIEWVPLEEDGWVLTSEDDNEVSLSRSSSDENAEDFRRDHINKLKFSVDINDLRSFQCVEPKEGKLIDVILWAFRIRSDLNIKK